MSRLTPSAQAIHDEALTHPCSFCGATSGQACRSRVSGSERDWPHAQRIETCQPPQPEPERRQALCCACGQVRTVGNKFSIHNGDANRSSWGFDDSRGWRHTCTLRCSNCGQSTRHALLWKNDSTEDMQRFVLGGEPPSEYWNDGDRDRLRAQYFSQFPRNPQLKHRYYVSEAKDAFAAGEKTITSLCGAPMDLDFNPNVSTKSEPNNQLIKPGRIDWETEFE